jgi:signal recognition particle subunit SRP54
MDQLPFSSSQIPDNMSDMTEGKIEAYNIIIDSMTPEEKADPDIIKKSRVKRIAEGSGTSNNEVRELLKHYRQTRNMVDKFDKGSMKRGGGMQDMMKNLGF